MTIRDALFHAVHVNHRGDWVFVRLVTHSGLEGVGELRAGTDYAGRLKAAREIGEWIRGRDARRIEAFLDEAGKRTKTWDERCAVSAFEQALWDLLGKHLKVPVHVLLGGACRDEVRVYANINRATTDRTPKGFARNAAQAVRDGFDAVKLAPFDGMKSPARNLEEARPALDCMQAVREAIGPTTDLLIDCHCLMTPQTAVEAAPLFAELDLFWYEQPTSEKDLDVCVDVTRRCGMTVAGGEQRNSLAEFWDVLNVKAMDVVMPDVTVVGGLMELKRIGDAAAARGVPTAPHGPFSPVSLAAGAHVVMTQPSFLILEYAWGETPWREDLVVPQESITKSRLRLPDGPGLGIELNQDLLEQYSVSL